MRKPAGRSWVFGCRLHSERHSACCWAKYAASPTRSASRPGWASPLLRLIRCHNSLGASGHETSSRGKKHTSATPWSGAHVARHNESGPLAQGSEPGLCSWCWTESSPTWPRRKPPDPSWTGTSAPRPSPLRSASPPLPPPRGRSWSRTRHTR